MQVACFTHISRTVVEGLNLQVLITFLLIAGVHDSYWTHACDVDKLNRILRENFVELYETPILENVKYLTFFKFLLIPNIQVSDYGSHYLISEKYTNSRGKAKEAVPVHYVTN